MACALGVPALAGCPSSATTTAYTPITGVIVSASDVTAGFGCGTDPGQVYRYAVLLEYSDDAGVPQSPVFSEVFECYAPGQLSNLPPSDAGSLSFDVTILAWNQASFPTALDCFPPSPASPNASFPCPGDDVGTVVSYQSTANWSTKCTATQQPGVSVLAVCDPLAPFAATSEDGGIREAGDAGDATE